MICGTDYLGVNPMILEASLALTRSDCKGRHDPRRHMREKRQRSVRPETSQGYDANPISESRSGVKLIIRRVYHRITSTPLYYSEGACYGIMAIGVTTPR